MKIKPFRKLRKVKPWAAGFLMLMIAAMLGIAAPGTVPDASARNIFADVVAIDQSIIYNRYGSFNPYGMMYALKRDVVRVDGAGGELGPITQANPGVPGFVRLRSDLRPRPLVLRVDQGDNLKINFTNLLGPNQGGLNAPATRDASIVVSMIKAVDGNDPFKTGISGISPGQSITYEFNNIHEGMHIFQSYSAPAGGEGDGGSNTMGLYGAVIGEPATSEWYRSQVSKEDMALARSQAVAPAFINYEAVYPAGHAREGDPILNILKPLPNGDMEIIYGDLNAIITAFDGGVPTVPGLLVENFREFSVFFQDEFKTFHNPNFEGADLSILGTEPQLAGVRDGFGMNYGASGLGAPILANRSGVGPAADCVECSYEEFFLEAWPLGDPALLAEYEADPSNVHHSYLGDNVRFRNTHMGPKETHVFHLHAHQWLSQAENDQGVYLDSQTIAPQMVFNYDIFYGGSGNRNRTIGDSIFHCHLYPHFAQGMWELWRTHDVFEDGTRRLPDGTLGAGTDGLTGATNPATGTPIPAIVPMPTDAMPPAPTYAGSEAADCTTAPENCMPGYPFYIAGVAGHRVSQPPLDLHNDAGLPRHLVTGGTRTINPDPLGANDFSSHLDSAHITILPNDGTFLEKAAMNYHAKSNGVGPTPVHKHSYPTITPEGDAALFMVNGLPPQPGAPFADPCPPQDGVGAPWWSEEFGLESLTTQVRTYDVSAIELDMLVSSTGWHDPQARINVLDSDVALYEGPGAKEADPFFFRANSGECVVFNHTNRTPKDLQVDDFQVKTPTDTIGQHIHLVKFDVTSSDGSGNGWNYEDGTFARGAVVERINASTLAAGGSVVDENGAPVTLTLPGANEYQTTTQRWWADPLLTMDGKDKTIRTVFTHDHFAPSSIQQHGFYNALVIEPAGSKWFDPQGNPLWWDPTGPVPPGNGGGVGTQAMIVEADDSVTHPDHREFMVAIADLALIYDASATPGPGTLRPEFGKPVNPPLAPEAITTAHHDPYLANYKLETPGQRIGIFNGDGTFVGMKTGDAGSMTYAFDSSVHGDPFTEIFQAYKGDRIQMRLIQGAQEVQHVFNAQSMRWKKDLGNPASPYVSAQPVGISEHFEMGMPHFPNINSSGVSDHMYNFGTTDSIWNGAWGLIRALPEPGVTTSLATCFSEWLSNSTTSQTIALYKQYYPPAWWSFIEDYFGGTRQAQCDQASSEYQAYLDSLSVKRLPNNQLTIPFGGANDDTDVSDALSHVPDGVTVTRTTGFNSTDVCPTGAPVRNFDIEAWAAQNLLETAPGAGDGQVTYNARDNVNDPSGLMFVHKQDRLDGDYTPGGKVDPLVMRANAGDCIKVTLTNNLPVNVPDHPGDAEFPKIFGDNLNGLNADAFRPSNRVSIHPQKVETDVHNGDGLNTGLNTAGTQDQTVGPGETKVYTWYAGRIEMQEDAPRIRSMVGHPEAYGAVNLKSGGDIVKQIPQGLVGMLVVEPEGAVYADRAGSSADISYPTDPGNPSSPVETFREFALVYQDGLNLLHGTDNIFDCHICDDSYDLGEQGFNYHSDMFWARLGLGSQGHVGEEGGFSSADTQGSIYPKDFFLDSFKPVEAKKFTATAGENVRFRVGHPGGLARQHTFVVNGHSYADHGMADFGSHGSSLIAPGVALTADLHHGGAKEGLWLFRTGSNFLWAGGNWGQFIVNP
jgi:manganese oxidase